MSEMKKVRTKAGEICYWADRSFPGRPTVVLLHGLSSNHTTWEPMLARLKKERINSIALDQRGHGHSDMTRRSSLYRIPVFADDLERVLETEEVGQAVFVGYSYGGPVLLEYARRHPDSVLGLVLISANCVSPVRYMGLSFLAPVLYGLLQVLGYLLVWQHRSRYHYYKHGEASGYWQSTLRGLKTMPISVNLWMLSQMFVIDFRSILPAIKAPTLIIRAEHDPFFSVAEADYMVAKMPDAKVVVPKHPSHFVASQGQEEIADLVVDFAL